MKYDFSNRRALVTSAGKGIGRDIAILLSSFGAQVVSVSRTQSDLEELKKEIGCDIIVADLSRADGRIGEMAWGDPARSTPMLAKIPLGKFAVPRDVSNAVAYLLSDGAAMIHGVTLPIDGGFLVT